MPGDEVVFRVRSDGPLTAFTRDVPGVSLNLWCNSENEILEVEGAADAAVRGLRDALATVCPWTEVHAVGDGAAAIVIECAGLPHDDVNRIVDEERCLTVPPTRLEDGWETHTIVSFSDARTRRVFQRLRASGRAVDLVRKGPLHAQALLNAGALGVNALLATLTDKQAEALLLALQHGFYRSPRTTTAAMMADAAGVSRSTFEEHLRKAEARLMAGLVPYLEMSVKSRRARMDGAAAASGAMGAARDADLTV